MSEIFWIILVISITIYIVFGDYIKAKAKKIHEEARCIQLENDAHELAHLHEDD